MTRAVCCLAIAGCLAGCNDGALRAFEPITEALGGRAGAPVDVAGGGSGGSDSNVPTAGSGGRLAELPLEIDDFEDGDTRAKPPLGWWYPINDESGTQGFGIEPAAAGATSIYALRTHGSGFVDWGAAVGVNLTGDAGVLSLPAHGQLCFSARLGDAGSAQIEAHLLRDARHYIRALTLTETWARHCLPLGSFIAPDGESLEPVELTALQFFFPPQLPFLMWLDDVVVTP